MQNVQFDKSSSNLNRGFRITLEPKLGHATGNVHGLDEIQNFCDGRPFGDQFDSDWRRAPLDLRIKICRTAPLCGERLIDDPVPVDWKRETSDHPRHIGFGSDQGFWTFIAQHL